ncbi:MAG: hypothetical protein JO283_07115 [Bradyrhizobium sp.]|nr:hypothetical protein [Bradyrhizobium sp.]
MVEATLHEHQSRLLSLLTITAAQRFGVETFLIEEDNGVRQMRMACVGDVVLLDYPADSTGPRSINCYLMKMLDFTTAASASLLPTGRDPDALKTRPFSNNKLTGSARRTLPREALTSLTGSGSMTDRLNETTARRSAAPPRPPSRLSS